MLQALYDGSVDYEDGTPNTASQAAKVCAIFVVLRTCRSPHARSPPLARMYPLSLLGALNPRRTRGRFVVLRCIYEPMVLSLAQYSRRAPRLLAPKCSSALPLPPCSPATGSASDGRPSKTEGSPSSEIVILISKISLARKVLHLIFCFALAIRGPLYAHTVSRNLSDSLFVFHTAG
jgi:hypothetical protein